MPANIPLMTVAEHSVVRGDRIAALCRTMLMLVLLLLRGPARSCCWPRGCKGREAAALQGNVLALLGRYPQASVAAMPRLSGRKEGRQNEKVPTIAPHISPLNQGGLHRSTRCKSPDKWRAERWPSGPNFHRAATPAPIALRNNTSLRVQEDDRSSHT